MANKLDNLKKFKKGKSGNPKGRPVGSLSMTKKLKEFLMEKSKDGETYGDKLKRAMVLRAISKSDVLVKEIFDRIDGKVSGDGDDDRTIVIKFDNAFTSGPTKDSSK